MRLDQSFHSYGFIRTYGVWEYEMACKTALPYGFELIYQYGNESNEISTLKLPVSGVPSNQVISSSKTRRGQGSSRAGLVNVVSHL